MQEIPQPFNSSPIIKVFGILNFQYNFSTNETHGEESCHLFEGF